MEAQKKDFLQVIEEINNLNFNKTIDTIDQKADANYGFSHIKGIFCHPAYYTGLKKFYNFMAKEIAFIEFEKTPKGLKATKITGYCPDCNDPEWSIINNIINKYFNDIKEKKEKEFAEWQIQREKEAEEKRKILEAEQKIRDKRKEESLAKRPKEIKWEAVEVADEKAICCYMANWYHQEFDGKEGDYVPYTNKEQVFDYFEFCLVPSGEEEYQKLNEKNKNLVGSTLGSIFVKYCENKNIDLWNFFYEDKCCLFRINGQLIQIEIDGSVNI